MDKGIPFDVAFLLDAETRFAWVVIHGNLSRPPAEQFDFKLMDWPKPKGT